MMASPESFYPWLIKPVPEVLAYSRYAITDSIAELPVKAAATNFMTAMAKFPPMAAKMALFEECVSINHPLMRAAPQAQLPPAETSGPP